jgi:hypothetical protein
MHGPHCGELVLLYVPTMQVQHSVTSFTSETCVHLYYRTSSRAVQASTTVTARPK